MHILDEVKKYLYDDCPKCDAKTPAHQVMLKGRDHAWCIYHCRKCGFWFKEEISLKQTVGEIGA